MLRGSELVAKEIVSGWHETLILSIAGRVLKMHYDSFEAEMNPVKVTDLVDVVKIAINTEWAIALTRDNLLVPIFECAAKPLSAVDVSFVADGIRDIGCTEQEALLLTKDGRVFCLPKDRATSQTPLSILVASEEKPPKEPLQQQLMEINVSELVMHALSKRSLHPSTAVTVHAAAAAEVALNGVRATRLWCGQQYVAVLVDCPQAKLSNDLLLFSVSSLEQAEWDAVLPLPPHTQVRSFGAGVGWGPVVDTDGQVRLHAYVLFSHFSRLSLSISLFLSFSCFVVLALLSFLVVLPSVSTYIVFGTYGCVTVFRIFRVVSHLCLSPPAAPSCRSLQRVWLRLPGRSTRIR